MKKSQYQIEFMLKNSSSSALWNMISTTEGLGKWFADKATKIDVSNICFEWNSQQQNANIKHIKQNEYIRFRWEDDPEKYYFEIRITKNELTGEITLIITDFAVSEEIEVEKQVWENSVNTLKRILGI